MGVSEGPRRERTGVQRLPGRRRKRQSPRVGNRHSIHFYLVDRPLPRRRDRAPPPLRGAVPPPHRAASRARRPFAHTCLYSRPSGRGRGRGGTLYSGGMLSFGLEATSGRARAGRLLTPHGAVETPAFMPVGTAGAVKAVTRAQLVGLGASILLANTYHLMLRPGGELVADLGGLHGFTGWSGPFLTDSGGYQVFSLAALRRTSDEGVRFKSH